MKAGIVVHPQIFYLPLNDSTSMYCSQRIWYWVRQPDLWKSASLEAKWLVLREGAQVNSKDLSKKAYIIHLLLWPGHRPFGPNIH